MANHHPNTKGLKPWPKGKSGNPGGKPKKRPITDEYFWLAEQPITPQMRQKIRRSYGIIIPEGTTWARCLSLRLFLQGMGLKIDSGAARSVKEIREAMEGKAPQRLEITGPERKEIQLLVRFDKKKK